MVVCILKYVYLYCYSLLVTYLNCEAHCDVSHNELVLFQLECNLKKGEFDARAGVIAGSILMKESTVHGNDY